MEKVNKILCEVFRLKENDIKDEMSMDDIEVWDSLTHMNLIVSLEENLKIQLDMDEIVAMKDIKTIKDIVSKKIN
ncbi:MAG: acyl carrier protein [Alphaproteobacteria bacterium]